MAAVLPQSFALDFDLPDQAATEALARDLAAGAAAGDVIGLLGDLGTGKTTFARAYINALPVPGGEPGSGEEEVPSPTFTLLQIYQRDPAPVWHFDLYRLERAEEVYELGFEEALGQAIALIEWAGRLGPLLPAERLDIHLAYAADPSARAARLVGTGAWEPRLRGLRRHA